MKIKNTKKIKIQKKNISKIDESIDEEINNILDKILIKEDAGDEFAKGVKTLGSDIVKVGKTALKAAQKLYGIIVSYPMDLFSAWYFGENIRAVHLKHAALQRRMTSELNSLTSSMSGMSDLESFLTIAAPHAKIASFVVEKGGKVDEFLEKASESSRKKFNTVGEEIFDAMGQKMPDWMKFATGDDPKNYVTGKISFFNNLLDIERYISGEDVIPNKIKQDVKAHKIDSVCRNYSNKIGKVLSDINKDSNRKSAFESLLAGRLSKNLSNNSTKVFELMVKNASNLIQLYDVLKNSNNTEHVFYLLSEIRNIVEDNDLQDSDPLKDLFLWRKDQTNESVLKLIIKNKVLLKEDSSSKDEEVKSKDDKDMTSREVNEDEDIEELLRYLTKTSIFTFQAIIFIDSYVILKMNKINININILFIELVKNILNYIFESINNNQQLIDLNNFNVNYMLKDSKYLSSVNNDISNFKETIEKIQYDKLGEIVPNLDLKKEFNNINDELNKNKTKINTKINNVLNQIKKITEEFLSKELQADVTLSKEQQTILKNNSIAQSIIETIKKFEAKDLISETASVVKMFNDLNIDTEIVNKYESDKEFYSGIATDNLSFLKNCINDSYITEFTNSLNHLRAVVNNSGDMSFESKISIIEKKIAENLSPINQAIGSKKQTAQQTPERSEEDQD